MAQNFKKKICLLTDMLNGGGAERSAGLLSIVFTELCYDVVLITMIDDISYPFSGKLINLGKFKNGSRSILNKFYRYRELYKLMRQDKFDIVLDFRMKNFPIREFFLNCFVFNTKMVNMIRSYNLKWYLPDPSILSRYLYQDYSGINTVSFEIKSEIEKRYNFINVNTIHNIIDINFVKEKAKENLETNYDFVLAVGRLNSIKQFDKLLDSYFNSILPQKDIKLYIMGEGGEKSRLAEKIMTLNLQAKVKLIDFQENPFKYMAKASFLILCSKNEGFPRVILEALACGTPVISFDCKSGPNEIIQHKKNGLLVENQNFKALTEAINELNTNTFLYDNCKINSVNSVEQFSVNSIGEKWKVYLDELLNN
jgi:glycosyltransferase involved in cell wall biosynthesis